MSVSLFAVVDCSRCACLSTLRARLLVIAMMTHCCHSCCRLTTNNDETIEMERSQFSNISTSFTRSFTRHCTNHNTHAPTTHKTVSLTLRANDVDRMSSLSDDLRRTHFQTSTTSQPSTAAQRERETNNEPSQQVSHHPARATPHDDTRHA